MIARAASGPGFALDFARRALGTASLHMIELFPDIELNFDQLILSALQGEYGFT
jgi:hypothetical protein